MCLQTKKTHFEYFIPYKPPPVYAMQSDFFLRTDVLLTHVISWLSIRRAGVIIRWTHVACHYQKDRLSQKILVSQHTSFFSSCGVYL